LSSYPNISFDNDASKETSMNVFGFDVMHNKDESFVTITSVIFTVKCRSFKLEGFDFVHLKEDLKHIL